LLICSLVNHGTEAIMNAKYMLPVALVVGAAVGGSAIQVLHAQATPVYSIVDISEITDPEAYKALGPKGGQSVAAFDGKFIVRTENIIAVDGPPPKRFVIIAFDSLAKAKAWQASAAQQEVTAIRLKSTKSRQFMVEAAPQ
jgi:uncharacterized protein (DUF1330 family)